MPWYRLRRRMPPARVVLALLISVFCVGAARADELNAPIVDVRLSGGAAFRRSTLSRTGEQPGDQIRESNIGDTSPTFLRLDAAGWFVRFFGIEAEASTDLFTAHLKNGDLAVPLQRISFRGGPAFRWASESGFTLFGSIGWGANWSPVVRYTDPSNPDTGTPGKLFTQGLAGRVGVGLTKDRFDGSLSLSVLAPLLGQRVLALEPRLQIFIRAVDSPGELVSFWVGGDAGFLLESSTVYTGQSLRFGLALRVTVNTPRKSPNKPVDEVQKAAGVVVVRVVLPDGAVATGAQVSIDGVTASALPASGEVRLEGNGKHTAKASLPGYRDAAGEVDVAPGEEMSLELKLVALTGPGRLSGVVRASSTGNPLAEATVNAGELSVRTGADGAYLFEKAGPGPVQVRVEAQGFTTGEEVAQVPPEGAATLDVTLEPLGKGSPATVRGLIRARSGKELKASVVLKGGKKNKTQKVPVSAEGRFVVTIPAGEYSFTISAPGFISQTKKVTLGDGEQAIFHSELLEVSK